MVELHWGGTTEEHLQNLWPQTSERSLRPSCPHHQGASLETVAVRGQNQLF